METRPIGEQIFNDAVQVDPPSLTQSFDNLSQTDELDVFEKVDDFLNNIGVFFREEVTMCEDYFSLKRSRIMSEINITLQNSPQNNNSKDTIENKGKYQTESFKSLNTNSPSSGLLSRRQNKLKDKTPIVLLKIETNLQLIRRQSVFSLNEIEAKDNSNNLKKSSLTTDVSSNGKSFDCID